MDKSKGQLSLDFLMAFAIYLAFLFLIIGSQSNYLQTQNIEELKNSLKARKINYLLSEQRINNKFTLSTIGEFECFVGDPFVFCGDKNNSVSSKLYYNSSEQGGFIATPS